MGETIPFNTRTLYKHLQACLRAWNSSVVPVDVFQDLLILKQKTGDPQGSIREFILDQFEELEEVNQDHANLLKLRYFEGAIIKEVARELHLSKDQVNRLQRQAFQHLAEIIHQKEINKRQARLQDIEARLAAREYTQLFGIEGNKQLLKETLLHPDKYHMVALIGLGGIGKSSIADAAIRELAPEFHFNDIIWLRFPQSATSGPVSPYFVFNWVVSKLAEHFALEEHSDHYQFLWARQLLSQTRCLVVIDNLHYEAQSPELFKKLDEFAGYSKLLLTTRTRPPSLANVFSISMNEISKRDAAKLLKHQLDALGEQEKSTQIGKHIPTIYKATGGNPLALKLCAGLLYSLPLSAILNEIEQRHINDIATLYNYVYRELWKGLSASARTLLEAMPLVDDNSSASIEHLLSISKLSANDIHQAIQELSQLSLLEPRGTVEERRYSIHQLTNSFLLKEVIGWDGDLT